MVEIAEFLGKQSDMPSLQHLEELSQQGELFVTVCGHYSAGKSKLINNLLEKEILPVKTSDTTAVITYMKYAKEEEIILQFEDGSFERHSLDFLRTIFVDSPELQGISMENLKSILVFCDSPLLQDGLILVDTPGVNSINTKHLLQVADALSQAHRVFYVMGGAMSDIDQKFLLNLNQCGQSISVVRTHCDTFVAEEENIEQTLEAEKTKIVELLESQLDFFPVSNQKDHVFFGEIQNIQQNLQRLKAEIKTEIEASCHKQLSIFATDYKNALEEQLSQLSQLSQGKRCELEEKIALSQKKVEELKELFEERNLALDERLSQNEKEAKLEFSKLIQKKISEFQHLHFRYHENVESEVQQAYEKIIEDTIKSCMNCANLYLDTVIKDENAVLPQRHRPQVPLQYTETVLDDARELSSIREHQQNLLEELKELRIQQKIMKEQGELEQDFSAEDLEQEIKQVELQLSQIPLPPTLIEEVPSGVQPSQVFKKVGSVADFALLVLPGTTVVKGFSAVGKATKLTTTLGKMGKVGETILKTGSVIQKNANALDKAFDAAKVLNRMEKFNQFKQVAETSGADHSVLDMLNISYWTEKVGKQFDKPPVFRVDEVAMRAREVEKNQLLQIQHDLMIKKAEKRRKEGLLKSEAEELAYLEKEKRLSLEKVQKELEQTEKTRLEEAKKQAVKDYQQAYTHALGQELEVIVEEMGTAYFQSARQNIPVHLTMQRTKTLQRMEEEEGQLEQLLQNVEVAEIEASVQLCEKYLKLLA